MMIMKNKVLILENYVQKRHELSSSVFVQQHEVSLRVCEKSI